MILQSHCIIQNITILALFHTIRINTLLILCHHALIRNITIPLTIQTQYYLSFCLILLNIQKLIKIVDKSIFILQITSNIFFPSHQRLQQIIA